MTTPLARLQKSMIEKNLTYYLIPSEDPHQSEYVDDHYKCRQFISGFTGSSGAVLAEQAESRLWTDGRYFTQAEAQIDPEQMKLMKMGVSGVPTILEYLTEHKQATSRGLDRKSTRLNSSHSSRSRMPSSA